MTINNMRQILINRFSPVIRGQLVEDMPDPQVVAIYRSLVERKDPILDNRRIPKKRRLHDPVKYEQIRMEI